MTRKQWMVLALLLLGRVVWGETVEASAPASAAPGIWQPGVVFGDVVDSHEDSFTPLVGAEVQASDLSELPECCFVAGAMGCCDQMDFEGTAWEMLRFDACDSWNSWLKSDERLLQDLQDIPWGCDLTVSVGGALRYRFMDERNRLRPPLAAGRSTYSQWRFTPHLEVKYQDWITTYAQLIDAPTFDNELPIVAIDENRWDLLQAYVDVKVVELEDGTGHYRYGRQLLTYGSQRLVSPLAWANTYRNFEGHRGYYRDDSWAIDVLAVQQVNGASRSVVYHPNSFDSPADSGWLGGIYLTNKSLSVGTLDTYWLWSAVDAPVVNVIDGNRHTLGARWAGDQKLETGEYTLSWDLEAALQLGNTSYLLANQNVFAGFVSLNTGLTFNEVAWSPTLSGVFWWGSGDNDPTDGTSRTVSTLYPLGHAYWGMIDNFNGSNLLDYSAQLTMKPTDKLSLLAAWHWFDKANTQDGVYNIAGVPFGGIVETPAHLGQELDLMATYQVNKNLTLQAGYFWYWNGSAIDATPLISNRGDAQNFYMMVDWTF